VICPQRAGDPSPGPRRAELLSRVAEAVPWARRNEHVRVAVDGVDGAGKSVFADQLAAVLRATGRPVIRASVDAFHHPRGARYQRGKTSPTGYWLDSFDYATLRGSLLDPLSPGGTRRYRTAAHDLTTDRALDEPWQHATPGAVLVLDGVFLHRDELRAYWDFSVFLEVPFSETARRMAFRDGTNVNPDHPSMARYVQGQRLYIDSCDPARRARLVVDNHDWDRPVIRSTQRHDDE
jgi:uridine kinase